MIMEKSLSDLSYDERLLIYYYRAMTPDEQRSTSERLHELAECEQLSDRDTYATSHQSK